MIFLITGTMTSLHRYEMITYYFAFSKSNYKIFMTFFIELSIVFIVIALIYKRASLTYLLVRLLQQDYPVYSLIGGF